MAPTRLYVDDVIRLARYDSGLYRLARQLQPGGSASVRVPKQEFAAAVSEIDRVSALLAN